MEAPATPGLRDSDLQQGDVQMLEQAQQTAPIPKRTQPTAAPNPRAKPRAGASQGGQMAVPDPIAMAASRSSGGIVTAGAGSQVDPTPWMPLLEVAANSPNAGGAISSGLVSALAQYRRNPVVTRTNVIDYNELDNIISGA